MAQPTEPQRSKQLTLTRAIWPGETVRRWGIVGPADEPAEPVDGSVPWRVTLCGPLARTLPQVVDRDIRAVRVIPLLRVDEVEPNTHIIDGSMTVMVRRRRIDVHLGLAPVEIQVREDGSIDEVEVHRARWTEDWLGEVPRTTHYGWEDRALITAQDAASIMANILVQRTRSELRSLQLVRQRIERLAGAHLRDSTREEIEPAPLPLLVGSLVELGRVGSLLRSSALDARRGGFNMWRQQPEGEDGYHRFTRLLPHHQRALEEGVDPARLPIQRGTWEHEHERGLAKLTEIADRSGEHVAEAQRLVAGLGAQASAKDAEGQQRLNRIAVAAAVVTVLLGTVLALYGADLLVPGKNGQPWYLLGGLMVVIAMVFAFLAWRADREERRWWGSAAGVAFAIAAASVTLAVVFGNPPAERTTVLDCEPRGAGFRCVEDEVPSSPD